MSAGTLLELLESLADPAGLLEAARVGITARRAYGIKFPVLVSDQLGVVVFNTSELKNISPVAPLLTAYRASLAADADAPDVYLRLESALFGSGVESQTMAVEIEEDRR